MDGRSLVPLLEGDPSSFQGRPLLLEYSEPGGPVAGGGVCAYTAIRQGADVLIDYTQVQDRENGTCTPAQIQEHYNLASDPFELQNLYPAPPGSSEQLREQQLADELTRLSDCAGIAGRDPPPASGNYCG